MHALIAERVGLVRWPMYRTQSTRTLTLTYSDRLRVVVFFRVRSRSASIANDSHLQLVVANDYQLQLAVANDYQLQ